MSQEPPDTVPAKPTDIVNEAGRTKMVQLKDALVEALQKLGYHVEANPVATMELNLERFEEAEDAVSRAASICISEIGDEDFG